MNQNKNSIKYKAILQIAFAICYCFKELCDIRKKVNISGKYANKIKYVNTN